MNRILFLLILLTSTLFSENIKVLLDTKASGALIEVKGRYKVLNIAGNEPIYKSFMGHRYYLYPYEKGIKWGQNFNSIHQIKIVPQEPTTPLLVNGIQYRGAIEIYQIDGKINIVNELDIEDYLKQTLSHQIDSDYEKEVCDSLAILARTNAYYLANKNSHCFWHILAEDTGFEGYALSHQNSLIEQAVNSTSHIILTYNNQPFPTAWTEHCGGKTANYFAIFRKDAITPEGTTSPLAELSRENTYWEYTISKQSLASLIGLPSIREIDLYLDQKSDKVYAIKAKSDYTSTDLRFFELQNFLGKKHLRSNNFSIEQTDDTFRFKGYGQGHGVGLCLYTADLMAEHGDHASTILSTFFPTAKITRTK